MYRRYLIDGDLRLFIMRRDLQSLLRTTQNVEGISVRSTFTIRLDDTDGIGDDAAQLIPILDANIADCLHESDRCLVEDEWHLFVKALP